MTRENVARFWIDRQIVLINRVAPANGLSSPLIAANIAMRDTLEQFWTRSTFSRLAWLALASALFATV
jgi:hypothetical protein